MTQTFNDGLQAGIDLLSRYTVSTSAGGDSFCSSAELRPVAGPTVTNKLFIAKIEAARKKSGTYKAGVEKAIAILEGFKMEPDTEAPGVWTPVPTDAPLVWQTLFSVELKRILNPDG